MTAITVKKGFAAICLLAGTALILIGGYYLWNYPIERGWWGMVSIVTGLLLHAIFWALWP